MKTEKIYPKGFAANSYILTCDGKNALVVDPAQPRIDEELRKRGLIPAYVLLTHSHFDHVGGVPVLQAAGAKVLCSEKEKALVGTAADLSEAFGAPKARFSVDDTFSDGEEKLLCGMRVKGILTPGHTAGGMCYLVSEAGEEKNDGGKVLFTGDTLFAGSIGRTDFPTGDFSALSDSLGKLAALPGDYPVYAGHEEDTTLGEERKNNPFFAGLS